MQDSKKRITKYSGFSYKKTSKKINQSHYYPMEIDLSKSIWSELEKGNKDIQLSTFWRIAEALDIRPHILIKEIESILGKRFFSFLE